MRRRTTTAQRGGGGGESSLPKNRPLLLVSGATTTVRRHAGHPHLGRLIQPRNRNRLDEVVASGMWWAADNDCFQGLDPDEYFVMLNQIAAVDTSKLLFVPSPDVVGDSHGTLALFRAWLPALRRRGLPAALVAQDSLTPDQVPWGELGALFIGGSTAWKEGEDAEALIRAAQARKVWVHVGRVNTERRLRLLDAIGIDSFDGTQFSMFPDTYIPSWLRRLEHRQMGLF